MSVAGGRGRDEGSEIGADVDRLLGRNEKTGDKNNFTQIEEEN